MNGEIDRRPTLVATGGASLAVILSIVFYLSVDVRPALAAAIALPLVLVAGGRGSRRALAGAAMALVLAIVLAAVLQATGPVLLATGVLAVTAWDLIDQAASLGHHVGRSATTQRSELVHGGATLLVGTLAAAGLLVVSSYIPAGWPVAAIVLAIVAGLFALVALDHTR